MVKGGAETKDYSALLDQLQTGDKLRFRPVLNPVKSLSSGKNQEAWAVISLPQTSGGISKERAFSTVSRSNEEIMPPAEF